MSIYYTSIQTILLVFVWKTEIKKTATIARSDFCCLVRLFEEVAVGIEPSKERTDLMDSQARITDSASIGCFSVSGRREPRERWAILQELAVENFVATISTQVAVALIWNAVRLASCFKAPFHDYALVTDHALILPFLRNIHDSLLLGCWNKIKN